MSGGKLITVALILAGSWQLGSGAYIHAKAMLAQYLLTQAWHRSLDGEQKVRPWPWADTWPVARLSVPEKEIDLIVLSGVTGRTLAFGPGHMSASPLPGHSGNSVIAGHRDTHFRFLNDLTVNDHIAMETADGGRHWFKVIDTAVTDIRVSQIRLDSDDELLTLVTCYPFDALRPGGPLRYVVVARRMTPLEYGRSEPLLATLTTPP